MIGRFVTKMEQDSFEIIQNEDGSYTAQWDSQDPKWNWLNDLTSSEIEAILREAIENSLKENN